MVVQLNSCGRDQIVVAKSKILIDYSFLPILHFPSTSPVFYSPSPECCGNTEGRGEDGVRAGMKQCPLDLAGCCLHRTCCTGPAHSHASQQPSLQGEGAAQPSPLAEKLLTADG